MSVPAYLYPYITPDGTGSLVYLVNVRTEADRRLEVFNVKFSNIDSPAVILVAKYTEVLYWSTTAPKACLTYAGYSDNSNSPVFVQQFGAKSSITNVYPNGIADLPANFQNIAFISPKLFFWVGSVNNLEWVIDVVNIPLNWCSIQWSFDS